MTIKLIIGLANPGPEYEATRHNAGAWFIEELAKKIDANFRIESKLKAQLAQVNLFGHNIKLAVPTGYMNLSGQPTAAILNFYKINPDECLIVHDEIDLDPGTARLKFSGGEGGHNGLRDISEKLGTKDYYRLRLGVGHPGNSKQVSNYVLKKPTVEERVDIDHSILNAIDVLPDVLDGELEKAMNTLHR